MTPRRQLFYGQMPGAYPAAEDTEEETYLQMMNNLAEEEWNAVPQQSQPSYTTGFPSRQQQYASQIVAVREPSYGMPASRQEQYASQAVRAKQPSYQKSAVRQHPYARPSVPAPGRRYQTSASGNNGMRQAGPIRHIAKVPNSQGLSKSQLGFSYQEPSAQQHVSKDYEGYTRPHQPFHDARTSNFLGDEPSQGNFGNEHFPLPQTYSNYAQSSMLDDQSSYQGQQYGSSQSSRDLQYAAYVQKAATMHGPSPYLAASSNSYAASDATTSVAANHHESRPATGPTNLEQNPELQPVVKEAQKPDKGKKQKVTNAKGSNEEKKPVKPKGKGQTRFQNGRLECVPEPDGLVQQWEPAVRMDDCRRELIDQQKRLAVQLGMSYRHPDPVGTGVDDETAFKAEHADWGSDRQHLPGICWRYNEDQEHNPRPSNKPGFMRFNGMIILDPNDDPVKDWPQLPATLSSKTRGYRLEIMSRENPHLEYKDFLARMPSMIEKTRKDQDTREIETVMEAPDPNVVCNMRMFRFRKEKGLLSWTEKGNTKVIGEGLEKLFGNRLINNSMQSFGRDLAPWEQKEIRKGKDAQFPEPNSAGGLQTQAATKKRTNNGATKTTPKKNNAKLQKASPQKRPREDDDEDLDSSDDQNLGQATAASYRKRRRNARGEASKPTIDLDKIGSNVTPHAPNHLSDGYYDEGGEKSDDEDDDDDDDDAEYEIRTSRRRIRPLPPRRARGGAKKVHLFDPAHTEAQDQGTYGNIGSQRNTTDGDADEDMMDIDDSADVPSSGKAHASVEDDVEEDVEDDDDDEDEDVVSLALQETDLERHRRLTREFLGEEDDFFFKPDSDAQWSAPLLFPSHPTECPVQGNHRCTLTRPTVEANRGEDEDEDDSPPTPFVHHAWTAPSNNAEIESLQDALSSTREIFFAWTGEEAPGTNMNQSYGSQFQEILTTFNNWWDENSDEPPPGLIGAVHFGASIYDWHHPQKDSLYYEAFKKNGYGGRR